MIKSLLAFILLFPALCLAAKDGDYNIDSLKKYGVDYVNRCDKANKLYSDSCFCAVKNSEIIKPLGTFHETMGTLTVIFSSLEIAAFIIYGANNKEVWNMPTTYSAIIPAGVTFGLGIWEFNIGHKLKCFKDN